ncbi:MAG: dUTP diphosphatase [Oscillospiraceae bacterium]|nr:dUTP diphosphatase [Oscillospiraceae bacterium]
MNVKFKKLRAGARIPRYETEDAAGMDICYAGDEKLVIKKGEIKKVPSGIAVEAEERNVVILLYARSGLSLKGLSMANGVGVIDSDYRGEIICPMINLGDEDYTIEPGERIGQIVFTPVIRAMAEEAEEIGETKRGTGGFGSTGRK